ncbi:hypothetical protein ACFP81_01370 [Deinococcus lacus]|uniref:Uncharacterized protein n=1 Tax=Deinococcus lacus TaxID=392561 RepID=A0ABW1Y9D5_9DEIO
MLLGFCGPHLKPGAPQPGDLLLTAAKGTAAPTPVDVLAGEAESRAAYAEQRLPAVGKLRDLRPWFLGLVAATGLGLSLWALWRR